MRKTCTLLAVVAVCAGSLARPSAQAATSLAVLTVPIERLPAGCRLEPVDPNATGAARFVMSPGVRENPWLGTRRPTLANLRQVVDGPGGPRYGLSGPALHERLADDVTEGYRARYVAPAGQKVEVYAVRFRDPALTRAASMNRLITDPPERPRIVVGSIAVLVFQVLSAPKPRGAGVIDESCMKAITEHIRAIK